METKELKIQIPKEYCIDESKSTFEKIVFKKKEIRKPRSWEEYCYQQQEVNNNGYFVKDANCDIYEISWSGRVIEPYKWKNVLPSKELTEVFLAMMQLMSLRHDWINKWSIDSEMTGDWEPDWKNGNRKKWCIIFECKLKVSYFYSNSRALSFPTEEMAEDFMNCFKDLLEIAKSLI